jgi:hypothetical protein
MSFHNFKCTECGFVDEFCIGGSFVDPIPDPCPKCGKGKMERQFSPTHAVADVIGGYDYIYGKKAWRNKSAVEQADILNPDKDGKYKDPW